ncbi:MAG: LysE family transporter, partial [Arenicellales bacterium]
MSRLPLFLVAAGILIVIPGPAVLYIVARSLDRGRLAGVVSALGVAAGSFFHIAAAALGLSALLASSAVAFSTVKYLGAAYLIFMGIR